MVGRPARTLNPPPTAPSTNFPALRVRASAPGNFAPGSRGLPNLTSRPIHSLTQQGRKTIGANQATRQPLRPCGGTAVSESNQTPSIKITSPEDVLDVLPTLLGFYPTESLCAVVVNDTDTPEGTRRKVAVTIRADMPTTPAQAISAGEYLERAVRAHGSGALVVAYTADADQARAVLTSLVTAVSPGTLDSVILAVPQGWTIIDLLQPSYVGWVNPYPTGTSIAAAQAAAAGLYAYGTRADIIDSVEAPDPVSTAAFITASVALTTPHQPTKEQRAEMVRDVTAYLGEHVAAPFTITTPDVAWLVSLIQPIEVRDAALMMVTRQTAASHVEAWRQVAALTPDVSAALPALCLLGMSAWVAGQGALANVAAARADRLPGANAYTLLRLLHHALDHGVNPAMWDGMRDDLTP